MEEALVAVVMEKFVGFFWIRSVVAEQMVTNAMSSARVDLNELRDVIELIEAQPHDELDHGIKQWSLEAKKLKSEAANLTETYMKKLEQMQRVSDLNLVKPVKFRIMKMELTKICRKMIVIRGKGEAMGVNYRQQEDAHVLSLQDTTSESSIYAYATSALTNLEVAIGHLSYSRARRRSVYRDIKRTRSELQPLFEISKQAGNLNVYKDYKVNSLWTLMIQVSFMLIDERSISFMQLSPLGKFLDEDHFIKFILQMKKEVFTLWSRWLTYGVGLVVPQMEPATLRSTMFFPANTKWKVDRSSFEYILEAYRRKEYEESLQQIIILFKIDNRFMDELWKDAAGVDEADERGKIWVQNMKELHRGLKAICDKYSSWEKNLKNPLPYDPYTKFKQHSSLLQSAQRLEEFIYFLTMRKQYYCIDIFVQRDGSSSNHTEEEEKPSPRLPSNLFKKDQVELLQLELQLMEALFQDVKTIRNPDDRLTVWIQEMHCVANHSKPIIEQISKGSFTSEAANTLKLIGELIRHVSEWSLTYDIGKITSGKGSSSLIQECKKVSPCPTVYDADGVDLIRREVRMMQALKKDIQKMREMNSGTLEAWLEEMLEVADEADILTSSNSGNGNNANSGSEVLQNVRLIKSKIEGLHQRRREYGIEHFDRKLSYSAEELRAILLADVISEPFRIIQVLGAWDNDKAFVKKFIEEDDRIVSHYALRIWLSAGEANEGTIREYIAGVMEQQNSNGSQIISQAEDILEDEFTQNRFLIVLDEIQSSVNLTSVRKLLRTSKGSRVILITSQINVDLHGLNSSEMSSFTMRMLPPQSKISILQMVPEKGDSNQSLTTPNPSIESIPSYLLECLYYFLLFPPTNSESYIPVRRLISLWVAEGFVHQKRNEDDVPLEFIAMRYLSELMQLGVVEAKEKRGKPKRCRLKDDKKVACLTKANKGHFLQEGSKSVRHDHYFGVNIGNIFRLTDQPGDVNNSCYNHIHDPDNHPTSLTSHYRDVISFLSFVTQERTKPGEDIGIFLNKGISKKCFLSLRILDLEHIFRPALPKELAKLIRLRYLGLRWTYLEALPKSVSELLNLQVLDVKHTYISQLPKSIWRMQFLRHLYLSETYRTRFKNKPYRAMSLTNLQTLWGAFVDEDSHVEGGLDTLLNVRKLGLLSRSTYESEKMARQLEAVANWVFRLKDLESLRLKSQDFKGYPSKLYLKPLSAHGNLSVLHISGILKYPSVISDLPLNLTEVTLSGCKLENDPLHSMEFLPRLIIVRLLGDASMCQKMRCSSTGFPKLEILKLWNLEMFAEFEVEERGMPLLQDFEVRGCPKLKRLADRLEQVCRRT